MERESKNIRFIDSKYHELFVIPDGDLVEVICPDQRFIAKCEYIDDYHTKIGNRLFHIREFAQMLEKDNGTCQYEEDSDDTEGAWRIGIRDYISIQAYDDGWEYAFYDADCSVTDSGQIEEPSIPINEIREILIEEMRPDLLWENRYPIDFEEITENAY